ncbi:MAG: serine/threonine-protein kinase [Thermoanaerobaculia bacterium]
MIETGNKGRFEVLRLIGRGAMGAVYLARDPVIGRRIALKTVRLDALQDQPDHHVRPDVVVEARTAGILSHPNIVSVYDVIEEPGGRAFSIAMEYVDGTNLATLLDGGADLPEETALDFAAQAGRGGPGPRARPGVIHRDIKPGNLLVTLDGRIKIADFGIAHLLDSALTEEMRFLGTPNYMAPERVKRAGGRPPL